MMMMIIIITTTTTTTTHHHHAPPPTSDDGSSAPLVNTRSNHAGFGLSHQPDAVHLRVGTDYAMRDWFALAMYVQEECDV